MSESCDHEILEGLIREFRELTGHELAFTEAAGWVRLHRVYRGETPGDVRTVELLGGGKSYATVIRHLRDSIDRTRQLSTKQKNGQRKC